MLMSAPMNIPHGTSKREAALVVAGSALALAVVLLRLAPGEPVRAHTMPKPVADRS